MRITFVFLLTFFLTFKIFAFENFIVEDIKIEGLQRVSLGATLLHIDLNEGDQIDELAIAKTIKSLHKSALFDNIIIYRDLNNLIIEVLERPTISSIEFTGNSDINDDQLEESLQDNDIAVGEILDRSKLATIEKGLEDFYHSSGKYQADVQAIATNLPRNRVDLKFIFNEGVAAKIKNINIIGNTSFDDETLKKDFTLKDNAPWWNFFAKETYDKQTLAADIETLRNFYLNKGYIRFVIENTSVSLNPNMKEVYITINIAQGDIYKISDVEIVGDFINKEEEIKKLIDIKKDDTYSASDLSAQEAKIRKFLASFGFAYPKVSTLPTINDDEKTVSLMINLDPGKRIYVNRINFKGNNSTKDEVLRREMRQQEGSWLSEDDLELSKTRLNRLGFFETVDYKTTPLENSSLVDIDFTVKEQRTGSFNAGLGYGTTSGVSYQGGISQSNFLGTGNSVAFSASKNVYATTIDLSYTDPYFTLDGISLGGRIYYMEYDAANANLVDYTNNSYGNSYTLGFPINETDRIMLGSGYRNSEVSIYEEYDQILEFYDVYTTHGNTTEPLIFDVIDVSIGYERNRLNRGTFPTKGYIQNVWVESSTPVLADLQFYKANYLNRMYFPLSKSHNYVFMMRTEFGYGTGYGQYNGKDQIMPFWENFYAGGVESVRGFRTNTIGPRGVLRDENDNVFATSYNSIGGNAKFIGSLEMFVPTPFLDESYNRSVRTSLFLDYGNVWDTGFAYDSYTPNEQDLIADYSDPFRIRASLGVSLQWLSPMGPMIFSLAAPIKEYEGDQDEIFGFTIGRTF